MLNTLNNRVKTCHEANLKWWQNIETGARITRDHYELLMLVVTELSEAVEGIRKNLMDDHLPHRRMEEVEMADAYIRLCDFAGGFDLILLADLNWFHTPPQNKAHGIFEIVFTIAQAAVRKFDAGHLSFMVSTALHEIEEYCRFHELDLFGAIAEKLVYNAQRQDHTHEARRAAQGKKF